MRAGTIRIVYTTTWLPATIRECLAAKKWSWFTTIASFCDCTTQRKLWRHFRLHSKTLFENARLWFSKSAWRWSESIREWERTNVRLAMWCWSTGFERKSRSARNCLPTGILQFWWLQLCNQSNTTAQATYLPRCIDQLCRSTKEAHSSWSCSDQPRKKVISIWCI